MADFIDFCDWLQGIHITGVNNVKEPPLPGSYNTDSGARKWIDNLSAEVTQAHANAIGGSHTYTGRIVILLKAISQDEHRSSWSVMRQMIKRLIAALEASTPPDNVLVEWTMETDTNFEGTGFYTVTCEVTGIR